MMKKCGMFGFLVAVALLLAIAPAANCVEVIAFNGGPYADGSIWIWKDDGSGECHLVSATYIWGPHIRLDGSRIAYSWSTDDTHITVWTVGTDCSNPNPQQFCAQWPWVANDWVGKSDSVLFGAGHLD